MRGLRLALGFLTTLDTKPARRIEGGDLGRAAVWFPVVGLGIGALLWVIHRFLSPHVPPLPMAAILVAFWVMSTGALHLDGMADCLDGLFAAVSHERRLEIMKDSRTGAFATVGVSLLLLLKVTAVAALNEPAALILAPTLGRWWMLPLAASRPARNHGLGAALQSETTPGLLLIAGLQAAVVTFAVGNRGWTALIATGLGTFLWGYLVRARIGGQTGDVLGANCELMEWVALLPFIWTV